MRFLGLFNPFYKPTSVVGPGRILLIFLFSVSLFLSQHASGQYIDRSQEKSLMTKLARSQSDTNRIQTLISLGKFHTYKQGKTPADLDSSYTYLSWAKRLSDTLKLTYFQRQSESMLITLMLNKGELAAAQKRYSEFLKDCEKAGDKQSQADAMFRYAIFMSSANSNSKEAVVNFLKAAKLYRDLGEQKEEIRILYELGFIHFNDGNLNLAEKELLEVIRRYQLIKYKKLHKVYNLLSTLYRIKGDFNKGFTYAILTIESVKNTSDTLREAYYYGDLARLYMEVGDREQAIIWYKKAVAKWEGQRLAEYGMYLAQGYIIQEIISKNRPREALRQVLQLGKTIPPVSTIQKARYSQNLAICYDALKQFALAEKYYLDAVKLYQQSEMNFEGSQEAYPAIGRFYIEQKQFARAGTFLKPALLFSPQQLSLAAIKDVHFMLFKVDSAEKKYLSAIDHWRIGKALDDSLFNRSKITEIEKLQIQFKTKQTQERYDNQAKLQAVKLEQVHQTQNVIGGFAIVLLLVFVLLLNQYRIKQSSNKLLQAQQVEIQRQNGTLQNLVLEKEWLVKEIHHRVKNNLQTIVSLLESQTLFLNNSDALAAVKNSQHRIHAMSLIHQKLYLSENISTVNIANYINELVNYLSESFNSYRKIHFNLKISSIDIDVAIAVPLGLILNEAITNSIKYAFKEKDGSISITFSLLESTYFLCIADDGMGLPEEFDDHIKIDSLGITLMKGLCKELGANFSIKSENGVSILISFPLARFKNKPVMS